jgi:2-alkenal reductase
MPNRRLNVLVAAMLVVLGIVALQPYIERNFYAQTVPRPIEARGSLADYERSTIALFEQASPSVVQIVGRSGNDPVSPSGDEETSTAERKL